MFRIQQGGVLAISMRRRNIDESSTTRSQEGNERELGRNLLPQELIDAIIDHVSEDFGSKPTLHSCSLTCKAWLPRSSFHLFRHTRVSVLRGLAQLERLAAAVKHSERLASYVQSVSIDLSKLILEKSNDNRAKTRTASDDDEVRTRTALTSIGDILSSLPFLQELSIVGQRGVNAKLSQCHSTWPLAKAAVSRLDKLVLFDPCLRLTHMLLSAFACVENLQVHDWWGEIDGWQRERGVPHALSSDIVRSRHDITNLTITSGCFRWSSAFLEMSVLSCLRQAQRFILDLSDDAFAGCWSTEADKAIRILGQNMRHFEFKHHLHGWEYDNHHPERGTFYTAHRETWPCSKCV